HTRFSRDWSSDVCSSDLPYANGHIHLGHVVEYVQTDIFVRFQKSQGHDCRYFCADDTHGAAIMIRARQENTSEQAIIDSMSAARSEERRVGKGCRCQWSV